MKKNLISIIILALLIVNIVLSAVVMFSVTDTNKKTADMVMKIAAALDMEIVGASGETVTTEVAMTDTATYDIADAMTIPLKNGADGKNHYYVVTVSLAMDTTDEGYATYGETIAERESLIKGEIVNVIGGYTLEEIQADTEGVKQAVLEKIQAMFDSKFIYQIAFSDIKYS